MKKHFKMSKLGKLDIAVCGRTPPSLFGLLWTSSMDKVTCEDCKKGLKRLTNLDERREA